MNIRDIAMRGYMEGFKKQAQQLPDWILEQLRQEQAQQPYGELGNYLEGAREEEDQYLTPEQNIPPELLAALMAQQQQYPEYTYY